MNLLLLLLFPFSLPFFNPGSVSVSVSALTLPSSSSSSISPSPPLSTPLLRTCNTDNPSPALRNAHHALRDHDRLPHSGPGSGFASGFSSGFGSASPANAALRRRQQQGAGLVIDTYMHFIASTDQAYRYNPRIIDTLTMRQIQALNRAFLPANITFIRAQPPTYIINDAWSQDSTGSTPLKSALRKGTYSSLNLYFQTNLSSPSGSASSSPRTTLLGTCTLPTSVTYTPPSCPPSSPPCAPVPFPRSVYYPDGCNILASTLPGQTGQDLGVVGYNLGGTAVHEVGHWFGLLHTFQGEDCDTSRNPGDYVDDTNPEKVSTAGCPVFKDSCGLGGVGGGDPIHNFMDYSNDFCYTQFTPLQISRMRAMWHMLREGL